MLSCNHMNLGLSYLMLSLYNVLTGIIYSCFMKLELMNLHMLYPDYYNYTMTLHGLMMLFYVVMTGLFGGLGNYLIPLHCGNLEMVFPRMNNVGFLVLLYSVLMFYIYSTMELNMTAGWTFYPMLSIMNDSFMTYLMISLFLNGTSSLLSSMNYMSSMNMMNGLMMNIFTYSMLMTSFLLVMVMSVLNTALMSLVLDMKLNTLFYMMMGDSILFQHLFWFFGHPEVYILMIPAFGFLTHYLTLTTCNMMFDNYCIMLSLLSMMMMGCMIWGHHMFMVGLEMESKIYYSFMTLFMSIPTSMKLYNWMYLYYLNKNHLNLLNTSNLLLLAYKFNILFLMGGMTGIMMSNNMMDLILHDTYYMMAHFHYVLSLAATNMLLLSLLYILKTNKISLLTTFNYNLLFMPFNLMFLPLFNLGFNIMSSRMLDYNIHFNTWNYISTLGSFLTYLILLSLKK